METGNIIKELRLAKGLSQKEVADAIEISRSALSQYENNTVIPTAVVIKKFASYFGVSSDYILGLEDDFGAKSEIAATALYFSKEEKHLVEKFRLINTYSKKLIIQLIDILSSNN